MQGFIELLQGWIGNYGFLGVIAAGILEELISPIPSSLVQGFAGTVLFGGKSLTVGNVFSFLVTVPLASAIGVTIGSLPYVWASKKWGLKIVDNYGKYINVTRGDIENLTERMQSTKWDEVLFVGLRAFPLVPNVALAIYAGITSMNMRTYIMLSMVGVFIRGVVVGGIGWFAGNQVKRISEGISLVENVGFVAIIALIGFWWVWRAKKRKKAASLQNTIPGVQ